MAQTVEELAEILDGIKLEADRNAANFDKILTTINNKLDIISDDTESDDLIKVYLAELKKILEERHSAVLSQFNQITNSFNSIAKEQENLTKTSEMKEMFDIFSTHMQSVAKELFTQKEILSNYNERFEAFTADKTDKNDIVNSVSLIRKDVEIINQGFESAISEINSNIQSIFKNLIVMDPTAQNDIVRRELENIYIATNSILTALHAVEQKNDDLLSNLENFITIENFEQAQEKLDSIFNKTEELFTKFEPVAEKSDLEQLVTKSEEISEKINSLPLREDLKYFAEKANELSSQIVSLPQKEDFESIPTQTIEGLQEKLDSLSVKSELDKIIEKNDEISAQFAPLAQKSDIDNVVFQTNEISEKINSVVKKEDFEQLSNKALAIEQKIEILPQQGDLADIYNAVHEFSTVIDTLRNSLTDSNETTSIMIREQLEKLNSILSAVVTENDFAGFRHDLADFIQKIIDNSESLNENLNTNKDTLQQLIKEVENLDIHKNMETVATALDGLRIASGANLERIVEEVNIVSNKIDNFSTAPVEEKIENVNESISTTNETIKNLHNDIIEKMSDNSFLQTIETNINDVNSSITTLKEASLNNVENIINEVKTVSSKVDNISFEPVEEKLSEVNIKLTDATESIKSLQCEVLAKLSEDNDNEKLNTLNTNIGFLQETILSSQASNETSLTEKLLALRDMITTGIVSRDEKFLGLQDKLEEVISNIEKISSDTEIKIGNSISEITELKNEIEQISKTLTEWNYTQETRDSKVVGMISSELNEIGIAINTLQDSVQAGVHQELTKNTENIEKQINNLIEFIETVKTELQNKDDEPVYDFEQTFKDLKNKITSVKQEINLVNTDIIDSLNARTESIMLELAPLKGYLEEFPNISEILDSKLGKSTAENLNNIQNAVDEIKNFIIENKPSEQFDVSGIINEKTEELKDSINEKISSGNEDLKTLISVAMNNDDITWAIDSLREDLSDKITRISNENNSLEDLFIKSDELLDKSDEISNEILNGNSKISKISELMEVLNQKIDVLAMTDNDNSEVIDEMNEIKNLISLQRNLLENSASAEKANAIENRIEELINKIDNINTIDSDDLKEVQENTLTGILNIFDQISFIEESEDIKDFVEEKTDEIHQNLNEVKQQLNQIVNSDDDYSYTLQDVESDIAKLRLVINELSTTSSNEEISDISDNIHKIVSSVEDLQNSLTQEQISDLKSDFEKLSEDILSISSRTNKLILTSDESYNALNNGLNDFSNIVYKLEERINYLDNKEITERIEQKLDNALNVVTESANSDKVMRQALMYMGEWIDTTSENIESLCEQSDKVNNLQEVIKTLQNKMTEQTQMLNKVAERFEEQQERMDRLELKLEKILSAIDDIDDTKLTKKVDKIDKQLAKLSTTIEKLATYVDE